MIRKIYTLWFMLCLSLCWVYAQSQEISGTVTSGEDGGPLPGVNVLVKGSTTGTVTDIDGNYRLSVPDDAVLSFSFIGFIQQEIPVDNRSVIDVTMESDAKQLTEVVVTAVGIEREKKALGYSVASVGSEQIAQVSEPDPLRAVQGKLPGVNITGAGGAPGQSTKINIRGYSSLTGNTQPLFVVDGIPFDNSTNAFNPVGSENNIINNSAFSNRAFDLDPNTIESMTVLKGAAAAALYGSRATNGVVVITTKAAKKGVKKGLEVTYSGSYNVEQVSNLPDYQNVYAQGSNQLYNAGFIGNWGAPFPEYVDRLNQQYGTNYSKVIFGGVSDDNGNVIVPATPEGFIPHPLVMTSVARDQQYDLLFPEIVKGYYIDGDDPQFITDPNDPRWGTGTPIGVDVPFQPYDIVGGFFEQGQVIENSINITAGGEKSSLTGSVSNMTNQGIVPYSEAGRTSLSFGGNGQLDNGLFMSGNVTYVNTTQSSPQSGGSFFGDYTEAASTSIFQRLYYLPRNYNLNGYPFESPIDGSNVFYRALDNPLWIAKYNRFSSDVNRVYGNLTLSYDIGDWLNLTAKGGINAYHDARNDIIRSGGASLPAGRLYIEDINYTEQDYNLIATVKRDFNEAFSFRGIFGFNLNQRERSRRKVTGSGIISEGLYNVDATTQTTVNWDYNALRRYYGAYADLQFSYNDYLFLNLVGRNDWASTLPVNNRSYFYPGVSASFVLSDAFNLSSTFLDYAKIRAARTQVGNEPSPYLTATYFQILQPATISSTDYNRATRRDVLGNTNLKPEFTTETEFGAEVQLLDGRVGLDVTWFDRASTDQIAQAKLPVTSGFDTEWVNIGELQNRGWEIGLDLTPVRTPSGFSWNIYSAFTRIRTEVVDAGPAGEIFIGGPVAGLGTIHRSDAPYGQIFGSKNARDDEGNLLINKDTGMPFPEPTSDIIGDPNPDFLLGITNTFTYKGFTVRALLDWKQGGDIYSATAASLLLRGQLKISEDREGLRVMPGVYGNPQTFEPVLDDEGNKIVNTTPVTAFDYHFSNGFGTYGQDEVNVYDGTTIRLREVALGYTLPKNLLNSTPFGSVRLMFTGRNLWFKAPNFLEGLNFDPEVLAEPAGSNVQGFDYGAFPTTRRYGVNLTVTF